MNSTEVQSQLNRRPQKELSSVKRVVAGVLGAVLLLGGIVAFVGGAAWFEWLGLEALGVAGIAAATTGRTPRWFSS